MMEGWYQVMGITLRRHLCRKEQLLRTVLHMFGVKQMVDVTYLLIKILESNPLRFVAKLLMRISWNKDESIF